MFNQNFKVMKQKIFTLVMMLALVIVAGSAMAQTKFLPYAGAVYSYSIDINLSNQSDAVLTATGLTTGTSIISNQSPVSLLNLAAGNHTITFDVTYSSNATGTCVINLVVTEDGSGCSNNIHVNCPIQTPPTMDIAISVADNTYGCQNLNATPGNNADASVGAPINTFNYIVTAGSAPDGLTGFSYTFDVSGFGGAASVSEGVLSAGGNFATTFTTTEGAGGTVTGTISGATFTLDAAHGGQTYNMTITNDQQDVTVEALPTIGTFN